MVSWALILQNSHDIFIVGAGLYSWFFNNYGQGCISKMTCQKSLILIDEPSTASIYNLFTVGTTEMLSRRGVNAISAKDNQMLLGRSPWTSAIASWAKHDILDATIHTTEM